jgi:AraC-like DNA-binding protein
MAVRSLEVHQPLIAGLTEWLRNNNADPVEIVDAVFAQLIKRGRYLAPDQRLRYVQQVVIGEFLLRWSKKHRGTTVDALVKSEDTKLSELQPFNWCMCLVSDERTFRKIIPRLARTRAVVGCDGSVGTADEFSTFVLDKTYQLAHRFLGHFDPTVPYAAAKAVKYIQVTAVSYYLNAALRESRNIATLGDHFDRSTRMSPRTKVAAKLAYMPASLTKDERLLLREKYGFDRVPVYRLRVKEVATRLGYPNASVLSRKFYRARGWIQNARKRAEARPLKEVRF